MKMIRIQIIAFLFFFFLFSLSAFSKVTVIDNTNTLSNAGEKELARELQKVLDSNGKAFGDSAAFANIHGYPVGTAILEGFPRFLIGMNISASFANMRFFDKDRDIDNSIIPVGSLNMVLLFGLGLKKGFDLMAKLMFYNSSLYKPPLNYSIARLKKMSLYSFGVKVRYNLVKKKKVLPGIFNWGGLSLGASLDFMYGDIGVGGSIEYPLGFIDIDGGAYDSTYDTKYGGTMDWTVFSFNPEIILHLNFFVIFDIYTGFGFPVHYGSFNVDFSSEGDLYGLGFDPGNNDFAGNVDVLGDDEYIPFYVQPVWVAGIEINIYILRFTFETMINLYNRRDISAQIGMRTQW